jgi:hypothetical protein
MAPSMWPIRIMAVRSVPPMGALKPGCGSAEHTIRASPGARRWPFVPHGRQHAQDEGHGWLGTTASHQSHRAYRRLGHHRAPGVSVVAVAVSPGGTCGPFLECFFSPESTSLTDRRRAVKPVGETTCSNMAPGAESILATWDYLSILSNTRNNR